MKLAELETLQQYLNYLSIKNLKVEDLQNLLKLKKELKKQIEEKKELIISICKKYELVDQGNDTYTWKDHEKEKEIIADIKIVHEADTEITPLNFLKFEEVKLTDVDNITVFEILTDHLVTK